MVFYSTVILTLGSFLQANKVSETSQSITPSYFVMH
jgi:cytochrome c-type biogenesis protein CcmE